MKTLLINPGTDARNDTFAQMIATSGKKGMAPPLGLLTAAALLPTDWDLRLVDVGIRQVAEEDWRWADIVMLTGNYLHRPSMLELISESKRRGLPVVVGGPYASAAPEEPQQAGADFVVIGEAENTMPLLVEALKAGQHKGVFRTEERPDVSQSPLPRYDLIENMKYYNFMTVQTTRGCPFNCEFCDVIVLNGRVPRFKSPAQVISELENLYRLGWRGPVFMADDNFIGNPGNAREILRELIRWQDEHAKPFWFFTQVSVNLGQNMELLDLITAARFSGVFVGIETPDQEILTSVRKTQNVRNPLQESLTNILRNGLPVVGSFMLGFDGEKKGAGDRIANLVEATNIPLVTCLTLVAIPHTSFWDRLTREGRLIGSVKGIDGMLRGEANFVPSRPADEIHEEFVRLWDYLYEPSRFLARVYRCYLTMRPTRPAMAKAKGDTPPVKAAARPLLENLRDLRALAIILWVYGVRSGARLQFWKQAVGMFRQNPSRMIHYINDCGLGIGMFRVRDTLIKHRKSSLKSSDNAAA